MFTIIGGASVTGTFDAVALPEDVQVVYGAAAVAIRRNTCPADIAPTGSGDGQVDVNDLLAIINAWGPCPNCPMTHCAADIEPFESAGNCAIDVSDLLAVINGWGPCP